jgi:hypothetical protein
MGKISDVCLWHLQRNLHNNAYKQYAYNTIMSGIITLAHVEQQSYVYKCELIGLLFFTPPSHVINYFKIVLLGHSSWLSKFKHFVNHFSQGKFIISVFLGDFDILIEWLLQLPSGSFPRGKIHMSRQLKFITHAQISLIKCSTWSLNCFKVKLAIQLAL